MRAVAYEINGKVKNILVESQKITMTITIEYQWIVKMTSKKQHSSSR